MILPAVMFTVAVIVIDVEDFETPDADVGYIDVSNAVPAPVSVFIVTRPESDVCAAFSVHVPIFKFPELTNVIPENQILTSSASDRSSPEKVTAPCADAIV